MVDQPGVPIDNEYLNTHVSAVTQINIDSKLLDNTIVCFVVPATHSVNTGDDPHKAVQDLITLIYALLYNGVSIYDIQQRLINPGVSE